VHAFQRRARHECALLRDFEQARAFDQQEGAKTLATAEADVPHGVDKPRRTAQFTRYRLGGEELVEERISFGRYRIETSKKRTVFFGIFPIHRILAQRSSSLWGSGLDPTFTG
jgi:hypothetical protein